jgi:hypothetical protein
MRKKIFTGYDITKVYIQLTLHYMNSVRPEPRNCILFGYISLLFKCYLPTYSLCPLLFVAVGVRAINLTRFIENTYNIYISK